MDKEVLLTVALFAGIAAAFTDQLFKPLRDFLLWRFPDAGLVTAIDFFTPYVSWVISGLLVWFSNINLFPDFFAPVVGIVVTALVSGFGANKLNDLFDWPKTLALEMSVNALAREDFEVEDKCECK